MRRCRRWRACWARAAGWWWSASGPEHFDRFHLNPYFPTLAGIDRARFPDPGELCRRHRPGPASTSVAERGLHEQAHRSSRPTVLERVRGRYISTLHLLDEGEYQRRAWPGSSATWRRARQPVEAELLWSIETADPRT